MSNATKTKYLIIGNSAGGIGAIEAIRQVDKEGTIVLVSDEPYPVYSRPLISEYLAEKCSLERIMYRPADFYDKNSVRALLGRKAVRLDAEAHTVELDDGGKIVWEKLLLATGGKPIVPQIKGIDYSGVFTFGTLDDAKAIDQYLGHRVRRAVVIGGGLIGMSVTEALVRRGIKVAMVEMKERILNTILDEETSALAEEKLKRAGVEIITGHTAAAVSSYYLSGDLTGVTLDDSRPISCELVVIAIGVLPRTELVAGTPVEVNRGIVVDRHMSASCPDIYACGDVAEAYDFVYGANRVTPIWPNAYMGGRIAGLNMAGVPAEYAGGTAMNSLKYFGIDVVSAGIVNPPDDTYEVLRKGSGGTSRMVVLKEGRVVGMVFVGNIERSGIVFNLIKDKVEVEDFKEALVAEDFGLVYLPEKMWRPRLEEPSSGVLSEVTSIAEPEKLPVGD